MTNRLLLLASILWVSGMAFHGVALEAADWTQLQGDAGRSGNAPTETLTESLGLLAAVPLTDAVHASPVVSDGTVYVIDGSGVVFSIDAKTFEVKWRFATKGGPGNCNNVAAPAVIGKYLTNATFTFRPASHLWVMTPDHVAGLFDRLEGALAAEA